MTNSPTLPKAEMAEYPPEILKAAEDALDNMLCNCREAFNSDDDQRKAMIADIAQVIFAERQSSSRPVRIRPHLRDCQFCRAKGDDAETVLFTSETDVVDGFDYGFSIRCTGCGVEIHDEYEDEVIRLWNGEDKPAEED